MNKNSRNACNIYNKSWGEKSLYPYNIEVFQIKPQKENINGKCVKDLCKLLYLFVFSCCIRRDIPLPIQPSFVFGILSPPLTHIIDYPSGSPQNWTLLYLNNLLIDLILFLLVCPNVLSTHHLGWSH